MRENLHIAFVLVNLWANVQPALSYICIIIRCAQAWNSLYFPLRVKCSTETCVKARARLHERFVVAFDISFQCGSVVLLCVCFSFAFLSSAHDVSGLDVCLCVRVPWGKMLQTVAVTCSVLNYMGVAQIDHDKLQTEDGWQKAAMQEFTLLKKLKILLRIRFYTFLKHLRGCIIEFIHGLKQITSPNKHDSGLLCSVQWYMSKMWWVITLWHLSWANKSTLDPTFKCISNILYTRIYKTEN